MASLKRVLHPKDRVRFQSRFARRQARRKRPRDARICLRSNFTVYNISSSQLMSAVCFPFWIILEPLQNGVGTRYTRLQCMFFLACSWSVENFRYVRYTTSGSHLALASRGGREALIFPCQRLSPGSSARPWSMCGWRRSSLPRGQSTPMITQYDMLLRAEWEASAMLHLQLDTLGISSFSGRGYVPAHACAKWPSLQMQPIEMSSNHITLHFCLYFL